MNLRTIMVALAALAADGVSAAQAHEGHDHSEPAIEVTAADSAAQRVSSTGTLFELVGVAQGHRLTLFVDYADTNAPVEGAAVEVETEGETPIKAVADGGGSYHLEADWLDRPGPKPLVFTVTAGDSADLLNAVLTTPPAGSASNGVSGSMGAGSGEARLWLWLGIGFLAGLGLAFLMRFVSRAAGPLAVFLAVGVAVALPREAVAHEGHDHAEDHAAELPVLQGTRPSRQPDGSVFLPKPTQRLLSIRTQPVRMEEAPVTHKAIGTVIADPSASGWVQAPMDGLIELEGQSLPFTGQKVTAGQILARLSPTIPLADLGTMQQLRAEVAGKLKVAEQKLSRLAQIATVVAQAQIDDTKAEIEALKEQGRVLQFKDVQRFDLVAPISGVISAANVRAGQVVNTRDTLFEIVDPERLWVEAAGADIHGDPEVTGAVAHDADGHTLAMEYVGRSPQLKQQSQSLLFRITEQHPGLAVGSSVTVVARRKLAEKGFVVPENAVVRGRNGLPQVWIKTAPESFEAVLVSARALDGLNVVIETGLKAGDRVVTEGAELLNQVR